MERMRMGMGRWGGATYLVLDVDEVLGVCDGVDVSVGNRVLGRQPRRPLGGTNTNVRSRTHNTSREIIPPDQLDGRLIPRPRPRALPPVLMPRQLAQPAAKAVLDVAEERAGVAPGVVVFGVGERRGELGVFPGVLLAVLFSEEVVPLQGQRETREKKKGGGPSRGLVRELREPREHGLTTYPRNDGPSSRQWAHRG